MHVLFGKSRTIGQETEERENIILLNGRKETNSFLLGF
jgi:hypothetical protein